MDKPQNASDAPAPSSVPLFVALGAGLVVGMLLAMFARTDSETTNWIIAGVGGLVAAVVAYLVTSKRGTAVKQNPGQR